MNEINTHLSNTPLHHSDHGGRLRVLENDVAAIADALQQLNQNLLRLDVRVQSQAVATEKVIQAVEYLIGPRP